MRILSPHFSLIHGTSFFVNQWCLHATVLTVDFSSCSSGKGKLCSPIMTLLLTSKCFWLEWSVSRWLVCILSAFRDAGEAPSSLIYVLRIKSNWCLNSEDLRYIYNLRAAWAARKFTDSLQGSWINQWVAIVGHFDVPWVFLELLQRYNRRPRAPDVNRNYPRTRCIVENLSWVVALWI